MELEACNIDMFAFRGGIAAQGGSFLLINNYGRGSEGFTYGVCLEENLSDGGLIELTLPIELAGSLLLRRHQFGISAPLRFVKQQ
jgi:hypothetical protein